MFKSEEESVERGLEDAYNANAGYSREVMTTHEMRMTLIWWVAQ